MSDTTLEPDAPDTGSMPEDWSLRPWALAVLLGIAALGVHLASDSADDEPWRMALTAFFFFGGGVLAFTLDRDYLIPPAIFAGLSGLVMAGIAWRATSASDYYSDEAFWVAAGALAVTLSLPLFQSGFHHKRFKTSYADTHYFVWTDAICGAGALAFTGLSWAVIAMLAELFELLQITLLSDLLNQEWFGWVFSGVAFGAALGVLRNQLKILSTLKSVVLLVLSLLAIPLAIALVLFLLAMIVSGPDVLWEATRSATPVLLACAVGAFVLTNAVIRDDDADMSGSKILRWAALVLALCILPLTVFAAVSVGARIAQHGLSPERIWALVSIGVATAFGIAYFAAVVRGRMAGWRDALRRSNLHLAVIVTGIALLLAMPVFDFAAISTRDQLSRLKSNVVSAEDFDFSALRWDFGEAGRTALNQLAKSEDDAVAKGAKTALAEEYRQYRHVSEDKDEKQERLANLRIDFDNPALAERLEYHVGGSRWMCSDACVALDTGRVERGHRIALIQGRHVSFVVLDPAKPLPGEEQQDEVFIDEVESAEAEEAGEVTATSQVEIREYRGRQIYVDGKPVGDPFD
ncbi:DUF4153 domain-containing protein [Pontixanthobacter aquaemixtae]|uniref:DUF4153 domain-containing protein n=1 Tax=Pontixanthobacter aquaemixtae TaxID=1958940 RepID=A0A844ZR25_9SPHN|nr:DUF4153 domain-containing protein [Pontixanthobacter aquaemixtae]MXO89466.1 DUF4153 domain-containing protein [Pontixanthobacter aquaemixtae]